MTWGVLAIGAVALCGVVVVVVRWLIRKIACRSRGPRRAINGLAAAMGIDRGERACIERLGAAAQISEPAAILMTTNCLQEPDETYADRLFTTNAVAWPGIAHVPELDGRKDFSGVIRRAQELGGFPADQIEGEVTVGFGHQAVLGAAPQIIEAVKAGAIRRFFLIGGCDGARSGRNYFTQLAEQVPEDCVILTLGCGKNRFNRLDLGTVAGFPKVLDLGQCNDAYSAIIVAKALAGAFGCGVNDLPLSLILSWYEQKAVAVLLTLLWLGVKNIRLGPTLPAFLTPGVTKVLVDSFQIGPVTTAERDLAACLA